MIDKQKIVEYIQKEKQLQSESETLDNKRKEFEEANKDLISELNSLSDELLDLKRDIKEQGLEEFKETKNKQLTGDLEYEKQHV